MHFYLFRAQMLHQHSRSPVAGRPIGVHRARLRKAAFCPPLHRAACSTSPAAMDSERSQQQEGGEGNEGNKDFPRLRFAILGGGLAGVATAWELLAQAQQRYINPQVEVFLFDAHGIASGNMCGGANHGEARAHTHTHTHTHIHTHTYTHTQAHTHTYYAHIHTYIF